MLPWSRIYLSQKSTQILATLPQAFGLSSVSAKPWSFALNKTSQLNSLLEPLQPSPKFANQMIGRSSDQTPLMFIIVKMRQSTDFNLKTGWSKHLSTNRSFLSILFHKAFQLSAIWAQTLVLGPSTGLSMEWFMLELRKILEQQVALSLLFEKI